MPLEYERAFSAKSAVGRYWLHNCVGFHVDGLRGGAGVVEEIGLGPDGVDVLAVRRGGAALWRVVLVPAQRVEAIHPWQETIVLASRRTVARDRRVARAQHVPRRLSPPSALLEAARAVRDGARVVLRGSAAFGTLLLRLAVVVRERKPHARRLLASTARTLKLIVHAYASEARRAWRAQKQAIAAWRESRREHGQDPVDDAPLTRARADDVDARRRDSARR